MDKLGKNKLHVLLFIFFFAVQEEDIFKQRSLSPTARQNSQHSCTFICVPSFNGAGLAHRLANAAQGALLSRATGYLQATVSFENGTGIHGNCAGADNLFSSSLKKESSRRVTCSDTTHNNNSLIIEHMVKPLPEVYNNLSLLGKWVRNKRLSSDCALVVVDEFWPSSYEPIWPEMKLLYQPDSLFGRKLRLELQYSRETRNVAMHIRVGDIVPTPLAYFAPCLQNVLMALLTRSPRVPVDVWVFAEFRLPELENQLQAVVSTFPQTRLRLEAQNVPPLLTFMYLSEADVLIASESGFSWFAALMSKKGIVVAPYFPKNDLNWGTHFSSLSREVVKQNRACILASVNGSFLSDANIFSLFD